MKLDEMLHGGDTLHHRRYNSAIDRTLIRSSPMFTPDGIMAFGGQPFRGARQDHSGAQRRRPEAGPFDPKTFSGIVLGNSIINVSMTEPRDPCTSSWSYRAGFRSSSAFTWTIL